MPTCVSACRPGLSGYIGRREPASMKKNRICVAYITTRDAKEAKKLGLALVKERLAACVNILGPIQSLYRWKGKLQTGREVALIAKTTAANAGKLTARVKKLH